MDKRQDPAAGNRGHRPGPAGGEVTGSGAGAGGGGAPEDFDGDPQGGGGDGQILPKREQDAVRKPGRDSHIG